MHSPPHTCTQVSTPETDAGVLGCLHQPLGTGRCASNEVICSTKNGGRIDFVPFDIPSGNITRTRSCWTRSKKRSKLGDIVGSAQYPIARNRIAARLLCRPSPLEFLHASGYARFGKRPSTNNTPHVSSTFIRKRYSAKLVRARFPRIRLGHVGSAGISISRS
jgi:hypothetical protein